MKISNKHMWIILGMSIAFSFIASVSVQKVMAVQPPLVSLDDQTREIHLVSIMSYLEDAEGVFEINDINSSNGAGLNWKETGNNSLNLGFTDSVYWLKGRFINQGEKKQEFFIEIGYPILDYIRVYILTDKDMKTIHLGDKLPFSQRPMKQTNFVFPILFSPGEPITIIMRFQTTSSMQIPVNLYQKHYFIEKSQANTLLMGCYFGFMMIMIIYNIFIFLSVRDINYLYYVLYVLSVYFFIASLDGLGFHYLWPNSVFWNDKILIISLSGIIVFASIFAVGFLGLKDSRPVCYKLFVFLAISGAIIAFSSIILPYKIAIKVEILLGLSCSIVGLFSAFSRWKEGFSPAKYYSISWTAAYTSAIVVCLDKVGIIPRSVWTVNSMQIGTLVEVMLLSLALADRLNLEKRERVKAQELLHIQDRSARIANEHALVNERKAREAREHALVIQEKANETLELKVKERTLELNRSLADINEVNTKINSSLRYARMIQLSMLPAQEKVQEFFPRNFILWKPQDIVGGDFYYMDAMDNISVVAVADSREKGVPGAFMTFIASSELKRIIRGDKCYDTGQILQTMTKRIGKSLKQVSPKDLSDIGLDIGLCLINHDQKYLEFSGFGLDLTYTLKREIYTIAGDEIREGFGFSARDDVVNVTRIGIEPGMTVYLSTDGLKKQPGEQNGQRFGEKCLNESILSHCELPLDKQCDQILKAFDMYRGSRDQADDVTMVAFGID
ncbi:MAG: SpoIIE family protein phosphatase [Proteobacteria bacterium]|nr:SpoIIE family protein phosphatase [Pseudomonadota bacterium]